MKQIIMMTLVLLISFTIPTFADESSISDASNIADESLEAAADRVKSASSLDEQLTLLHDLSVTHAAEFENSGWNASLSCSKFSEEIEALVPDVSNPVEIEALPETLKGSRFIVLFDDDGSLCLLGDFQVRLPEDECARTLNEADAVLYLKHTTPSRTDYIGFAHDRVYTLYAAKLDDGEVFQLFSVTTTPPLSGTGVLYGARISVEDLWRRINPIFYAQALTAEYPEGTAFFRVTGMHCCLTGLEGTFTHFEIPAEVEGHPVTGIEGTGCDTLEELVLPEGIEYIDGREAISGEKLTRMNFPASLRRITGDHALPNQLEALELNEGLEELGSDTTYGSIRVKSLTIPSTLKKLPHRFMCNGIACPYFIVSEGITEIGYNVLDWTGYVQYVYLPASLEKIESDFLRDDWEDRMIHIYTQPDSVGAQWAEEKGYVWVPCDDPADMPRPELQHEDGFTYALVEGEAVIFEYDGDQADVVVPEVLGNCPVTRVEYDAFDSNTSLRSLRFPNTLRRLADFAIWNCTQLEALYIPASVEDIDVFMSYNKEYVPCVIYAPSGSVAHEKTLLLIKDRIENDQWMDWLP